MSAPDLAARIALALGLVSCAGARPNDGSTTGGGDGAGQGSGPSGTGAGLQVATQPGEVPLPAVDPGCPTYEPSNDPRERRGGCMAQVQCRPPLDAPPDQHFPAPYERCETGTQPMGGGFAPSATAQARKQSPDVCCYAMIQLHPAGRPLRDAGAVCLADLCERGDWLTTIGCAEAAGANARSALAQHFRRAGLVEHSSVASFVATTLGLLALGAPAGLVEESQRAALDEVEHAKLCFGLAAALDGRCLGPTRLATPARTALTVDALVESLVVDGCVGEVAGALEAQEAARSCEDPAIRSVLERIAREESAHAELAYRTLAWVLEAHPTARAAAAAAYGRVDHPHVAVAGQDEPELRAYGVLRQAEREAIVEEAKRVVAKPLLAALLGRQPTVSAAPEPESDRAMSSILSSARPAPCSIPELTCMSRSSFER